MTNERKERFTPGPWRFCSGNIVKAKLLAGKNLSGIVCECNHIEMPNEANARLIAAAPEMLAALNLIVERLSAHVNKMSVKNHFHEKVAMEAARSAIRKALGE